MMLLEKLAEGSLVGKMQLFGNLADGDTIDDATIPLTIADAGYFGTYTGVYED